MTDERILIRNTFTRYHYCRDNGHLKFVQKANTCDDYVANRQWDPLVKKRLERQGKPVLTINKILATMAVVMGEQLHNRADITFKPAGDGSTQELSETLNKVYLHIDNDNKLDWVESDVADSGFITSRGFYDVRMKFDNHMQGDIQIRQKNPRNVLIDPDAEEYDPDTWKDVITSQWLTLDDIAINYGQDKADQVKAGGSALPYDYDSVDRTQQTFGGFTIPPENTSVDDSNTARKYRIVERQYKKKRNAWHFVSSTGDIKQVPEEWTTAQARKVAKEAGIRLIRKLIEQIRWTVVCYNTVLFDNWSPYKHFTIVPYFPYFRNGTTLGIVEGLISSQDLLNKTASQELHIVNTTANSGWKVKRGSLTNMDIDDLEERGAETGLVMELADIKDAEKITPNTVPSGLDRISFKANEFIKDISGISDSQRGMDRADVAAKAIAAKQAAGSVNLAKPFDNLARTRYMVARNVVDLLQVYYTEERMFHITGNRLDAQTEEVRINYVDDEGRMQNDITIGKYSIVVSTAPDRDNYQDSQFQEALQLREIGVTIPDSVLIQNSSLDNKKELLEQNKPSPEQQEMDSEMRQLEIEEKKVDIAEKQTKAILNRAQANLALARSQEVGAKTEGVIIDQEVGQPGSTPGAQPQLPDPMAMMQQQNTNQESKHKMRMEEERLQFDKDTAQAEREDKIREGLEARAADAAKEKQAATA